MLGGSGTCESFEAGDRLGCSTTKRVSLAECIRDGFTKRLGMGLVYLDLTLLNFAGG